MNNETIKPILLKELMEIPVDTNLVPVIKDINRELIEARKSGKTTVAVQIHDEESVAGLLYEYSNTGFRVKWNKYTKELILKWG